jgi:hypothetical protein
MNDWHNQPPEQWTRTQKIQYLLEQWDAIYDYKAAATGNTTDPLGAWLMPAMANHQSVRELTRVLNLLHTSSPTQYQHLKSYHCGAEWRIRTDHIRKRRPTGKGYETLEIRRREKLYPRWIRLEKVRRAEQFLTIHFQGEVFIPNELWDALHRPAVAA